MRGRPRSLDCFDGKKLPFQRKIQSQYKHPPKQRAIFDDPNLDKAIAELRELADSVLEFRIIHRHELLTSKELNAILKAQNKTLPRDKRMEYYSDFLPYFRDEFCIPAMRDVVAGTFLTMRAALLRRLQEREITLTSQE